MRNYLIDGENLRNKAKLLVFDYMQSVSECASDNDGMRQAEISRVCGLVWGDYENTTASHQVFWIVGLLRELEKENKVQRDLVTKKWRLK